MQDPLTSLGRRLGRHLPMKATVWLARLRMQQHPWQRRQRILRRLRAARDPQYPVRFNGGSKPTTVVWERYDAQASATQNQARVRAVLAAHGIDAVTVQQRTPLKPLIIIEQEHTRAAVQALLEVRQMEGWTIRFEDDAAQSVSLRRALRSPDRVAKVVIERRIMGPSGTLMSTSAERVTIEPWERLPAGVPRADGSTHLEGTLQRRIRRRNTPFEYLTPNTWAQMSSGGAGEDAAKVPHLYEVTEPVDVVYTWVDGNDPEWRARKARAQGLIDPGSVNETALSESRFTSRDELKYSLRSLEAYASWVNHIYLVTDRQVPEWLRRDHPKLTVVDHREIFSDPSVLPVFNSHAIESQLHHIPGLSEQYLYMNDDLFFLRPVRPEQFFTGSGLWKFFPSRAPLDIDEVSVRDLPVLAAAKNGRAFMRQWHGRTVTNKFKHTPHPQRRSVLAELEAQHPELFRQVASARFRDPTDVSIASSLIHFHGYATGRAIPGSIAYDYLDISSERAPLRLEWFAFQRKLDVVCLNDTDLDPKRQAEVSQLLGEFLERRFPIPSTFERELPE